MVSGVPLVRPFLLRLRRRALRCRAWFKLEVEDRRFLDLVIATVERVRSLLLAGVLKPILGKLMKAMGGFQEWMEAVYGRVGYWMIVKGRYQALKLSQIAQGWENRLATDWAKDLGFIRYLAVMELNRSGFSS
ncbi:hypothetical protein KEJ17_06670 [Candidatus Bathyarchaeota archaeon]|nr:hypothetical protein [Candidatus Bathyarchaeota archaeon]